MIDLQTALAFHRFGLGARPGDMARMAGAPRKALLDEVTRKSEPSPFAGMLSSTELLVRFMDFRGERKAVREAAAARAAGEIGQPPKPMADMTAPTMAATPGTQASPTPPAPLGPSGRPVIDKSLLAIQNPVPTFSQEELAARLQAAAEAPIGFQERLVLFWANHFTVSGVNPRVRITCGAFEREAIRPHIAGRFEDMLQAVAAHPAMLMYLDNAGSFGPNSQAGRNRKRGLNENLAREILELHTLGVAGGYSQNDVTRFAEVLTGWSVVGAQANGGEPGTFIFRPQMHEPGSRKVLGSDYPQAGIDQGRAVLSDLARHPSTPKYLATKLVRHFIADVPPPAAVDRVAAAFTASGGQLMAVYEALLTAPEAWQPAAQKLRQPYEFVVGLYRALRHPAHLNPAQSVPLALRLLNLTGQAFFSAPSPKGWPEEVAAWTAPDAFKTRLDFAETEGRRAANLRPLELAEDILGPRLSEETRTAIRRAESSHQGLALMLMSPEFQRR